MGNCCSNKDILYQLITVGTLNYSGILNSPFEFYSNQNQHQERRLSEIFNNCLRKRQKEIFNGKEIKWQVGEIDKKIQLQRYTPIYRKSAGIQNGKLLTEKQFLQKWDIEFNKALLKVKTLKYDEYNRLQVKWFDLLCYQTFINYIYKGASISNESIRKLQINDYSQFLMRFHENPFVNEDRKIKKTMTAFVKGNIDVLFIQEASKVLKKKIQEQYSHHFFMKINQNGQSVILVKQKFLKEFGLKDNTNQILQTLDSDERLKLNWNQDTIFLCLDSWIFISGHLSSKKQKNKIQVQQVAETLNMLIEKFQDKSIVVGIDANTPNLQISPKFQMFPLNTSDFTTCKKRTFIQLQTVKANTLAKEKRDYLISNRKLKNPKITTIELSTINEQYFIPSKQHPFDHFLLLSQIQSLFVKKQIVRAQ